MTNVSIRNIVHCLADGNHQLATEVLSEIPELLVDEHEAMEKSSLVSSVSQ